MKAEQLPTRFTPLTPIATTQPVLFVDKTVPLAELHACASERLHATLDYLTLMACATLRDSRRQRFQHSHQRRPDSGPGCYRRVRRH